MELGGILRMKKIYTAFIMLVLSVFFVACGNDAPCESSPSPDADASRVLIAYFSLFGNADYPQGVDATTSASIAVDGSGRYGTTEYIANMIKQAAGGDIHLIQTATPYPVDFDEVIDQNHKEMEAGYLPPLKSGNLNIEQYDTVFIGYPVWATTMPQAIVSFLSRYDLSGKTVIPFCTHDGYGSGRSYADIRKSCPRSAVLDGLSVEAHDAPSAKGKVDEWLQSIDIVKAPNGEAKQNETPITITIGDAMLNGLLYNTALAKEVKAMLPLTVSMVGYGGREYYGGISKRPSNAGEGKLNFEDGDITYCSQNNTMAIFYAQTDNPNLTMQIIPIGKVTSNLSVFDRLGGRADITFALAD
jgi:flavodoxin